MAASATMSITVATITISIMENPVDVGASVVVGILAMVSEAKVVGEEIGVVTVVGDAVV